MDATRISSSTGPASDAASVQPWHGHHGDHGRSRVDQDHDVDRGPGDRFTSSSQRAFGQDAEDAGLFSVSSVSFFSAAATFFLAQTSPSSASQASTASAAATSASVNPTTSAAAPAASVTPPTTTAPAASATSDAAAPTTTQVTHVTQPAVAVPASSAPTTSGSTAAQNSDSNSQNPLQALNNSLAALGLNQQEIQAFDQIASFIQAVSPTAFADLVNGLQTLAQQVTQAAAAPSTQSGSTAAASGTSSASDSASGDAGATATAVPATGSGTTSTGSGSAVSASNGQRRAGDKRKSGLQRRNAG